MRSLARTSCCWRSAATMQPGSRTPSGSATDLTPRYQQSGMRLPDADRIVLGIPEVRHSTTLGGTFGPIVAERASELREIQRALLADGRSTFVDTARVVNDKLALETRFVSPDGFHPNADGYAASASLVADQLDRLAAWRVAR